MSSNMEQINFSVYVKKLQKFLDNYKRIKMPKIYILDFQK
jgi:hypothetical protein